MAHPQPSDWQLAMLDWDGTQFNSLILAYQSACEIFRYFGVSPPSLETYRSEIGANFKLFYYTHGVPKKVTLDEMNGIRRRFFNKHWGRARLYPETRRVLSELRRMNLRLATVSAEINAVLEKRLRDFNLRDQFHCVRGEAWPKDVALTETIQKFGLEPHQAFYVDDTADGIASAKRVGVAIFGITHGYNSRERIISAKPDFVINSLSELIGIIENERRK